MGIVWLAGPTERLGRIETGREPTALDSVLFREEKTPDIVSGCEARIVWRDPVHKHPTKYAVVNLHGFSACRQEISPVCSLLADSLDANLFEARLSGHGRTGMALAQASAARWIDDSKDAVSIGNQIGARTVVVGVSTGGALAAMHASIDPSSIDVLILVSPNFGLRDKNAKLLLQPWARQFVPLVIGKTRGFKPQNELHARFWTETYPVEALFPMIALVDTVGKIDPAGLRVPLLVFLSPLDNVVDPEPTLRFFEAYGAAQKKKVLIENADDPQHHLITGNVLSPNTVEYVVGEMTAFIRSIDSPRTGAPAQSNHPGSDENG